jgi:uncharacterized protein YcfJ
MDRDSYEPSQYSERGYVARDGYARDARSDAYEQASYGSSGRAYPANTEGYSASGGGGYGGYDRQRSYDDRDLDDYYERTKITKYRQDNDRGLDVYRDRDRERARSQDYRREERARSRGRRGSGGSGDDGEGGDNTPLKKWAATFAGAAVGGIAANRFQKKDDNWMPTAIGAVVGGLVGREVEKKVYEHKERRKEREQEERY